MAILFVSPVLLLVNSSFKTLQEIYINILALPEKFSFNNYIQAFEQMDLFTVPCKLACDHNIVYPFDTPCICYGAWVLVRVQDEIE